MFSRSEHFFVAMLRFNAARKCCYSGLYCWALDRTAQYCGSTQATLLPTKR
jgi:hypothetical protein